MKKSLFLYKSMVLNCCFIISISLFSASCHVHNEDVIKGRIVSEYETLKVLEVWGTHYERGVAQGYFLAENIKDIYTGYIQNFMGAHLEKAQRLLEEEVVFRVDKVFHDEAKGIIDGMAKAGVVIEDFTVYHLLLSNAFLDVMGLSQMIELRNRRKMMGCSVLMSWGEATKNTEMKGLSVVTRHLDWPVQENVINNQVVIIHKPEESDEQAWLMVGFAGQIAVLSAINASKHAVFLNMMNDYEVSDIPLPDKPFEPLGFTLRKAVEKKDFNKDGRYDIFDIRDALKSNTQGYAEGFIVSALGPKNNVDTMTAFIAELAPTYPYIVFRNVSENDSLKGTHLYTANSSIARLPHEADFCTRYVAVSRDLGDGLKIDAAKSWQIMKTASSLKNNIQFMQYIPHEHKLLLSIYLNEKPAYLNEPLSFDLNDFLGK